MPNRNHPLTASSSLAAIGKPTQDPRTGRAPREMSHARHTSERTAPSPVPLPLLGAHLFFAALSLAACRASPRHVETTHAVSSHRVVGDVPAVVDAAADAAVIDSGVQEAAIAADAAAAPDAEPERTIDLSRFGLRRNRLVSDPGVLLDLFYNVDYWVPMSDGACARLRFRINDRGAPEVTAGGYTAMVLLSDSPHRRGQPAEFSIADPEFRVFRSFPANERGVVMFLAAENANTRYRIAWDGTSLALTTANSIPGNAVVRLHPEQRTCLPEAAEFHTSGMAP